MLNIPRWLVFLVAFWVITFGVFRIYIARQKLAERDPRQPNFRRGGLYAQSRRRHIVFGLAYVALGGVLISMGFGVQLPMYGGCQGDAGEATETAPAPAERTPSDTEPASSIEARPSTD